MLQFFYRAKNKKGFTLIELIVVIAILGIIALIAIPRFANFQYSSKVSADQATAKQLVNSARIQETQTGTALTQLSDLDANIMVDPGNAQSSGAAFGLSKDAVTKLYEVSFTATAALAGPYAGLNTVDESGVIVTTLP